MPSTSNTNGNKKSGGGGGKPKRKPVGKNKSPSDEPGRKREDSEAEDVDANCQVCMNKMTVFSIGQCNHPICLVCSTRMRVLCQKNECAICRQDMPMVIFTLTKQKFEDIKDNIYPMDRKYKICFETEEIQNIYTELLSHKNPLCPEETFQSFKLLDKHMRRNHELYYCELCVTNLRLYSHERKLYTRKQLVEHRRKGDPDDTSMKGHPLCEFCDTRFFDDEELFKHLRQQHYFCHFCDADGVQYFFNDYPDLRQHFIKDHFPCLDPECEKEKWIVFRTEIDLKGHMLDRHHSDMSKAASREARKVELEFNYNNYNSNRRDRERGGGRDRREERREERGQEEFYDQLDGPVRESGETVPDMFTDFPSLSGRQVVGPGGASAQSWTSRSGAAPSREEEFPSLPGAPPVKQQPRSAGVKARTDRAPAKPVKSRQLEDFPTLPGSATPLAPRPTSAETFVKKKNIPSKEPPRPSQTEKVEDFPSLPLSSKPLVTSASARTTTKKQTVIKQSPVPLQKAPNSKKAQKKPERYSDEEEDYPSLATTSIQLNNFTSRKTVQSSGQDLAYSSSQISSNIKTVDKSFLESQSSSSNAAKPVVKVKMNSTMDFPDLGRPQQALDLSVGKKNPGKKQNKKKGNDNNNGSNSERDAGKTSLNAICEFLHDGGGNGEPRKQEAVARPGPAPSPGVRPLSGKGSGEDVARPSRLHQNNNQVQQPPANTVKPLPHQTEDFPTLGKASKKIGRNFVSVEEKKLMSAPSMWNKKPPQKENVAQPLQAPQKTRKMPPGFGNRNKKAKYSSPADFQERNFALITTITDLLGAKSLEFKTFKEISGKFRNGQIGSSAYFTQCKELIEEGKFSKIFPELLSLLPDIEKQQELFRLYQLEPWSDESSLTECDQCWQICLNKDGQTHAEAHNVDNDFPEL